MGKSQIIIFDVEHGFCSYLRCPNGYSLMIDCGGRPDFSPAKFLKTNSVDFFPVKHNGYHLTKLVVTHPHGDHVEDVDNLMTELPPAILKRTNLNNFANDEISLRKREKDDVNLKIYRQKLDEKYNAAVTNIPNWGFTKTYFSLTPAEARQIDKNKVINNTSHVLLLEVHGRKILFSGDLESPGWDALIKKYGKNFTDKVSGVDIFVTPHHGHRSGFSSSLFEYMGKPYLNIISKESESKDGTDVDGRYSSQDYSRGASLEEGTRYSLTTRQDGSIFIEIEENGQCSISRIDCGSNIGAGVR